MCPHGHNSSQADSSRASRVVTYYILSRRNQGCTGTEYFNLGAPILTLHLPSRCRRQCPQACTATRWLQVHTQTIPLLPAQLHVPWPWVVTPSCSFSAASLSPDSCPPRSKPPPPSAACSPLSARADVLGSDQSNPVQRGTCRFLSHRPVFRTQCPGICPFGSLIEPQ